MKKFRQLSEQLDVSSEHGPNAGRFSSGASKKAYKAQPLATPRQEVKMEEVEVVDEARMSAAVKLQRAFQREQEKSASERKAGEELMKKPEPVKEGNGYDDNRRGFGKPPREDDEYHVPDPTVKKLKKEEVVQEGRPSQRHPLEGHEYHKKTNAELEYIAKDAHKAAEAMKSHNTTAENKYRDQASDSATVRYYRQKNGMQPWYKKKYGHVNESRKAEIVKQASKDAKKKSKEKKSDDTFQAEPTLDSQVIKTD